MHDIGTDGAEFDFWERRVETYREITSQECRRKKRYVDTERKEDDYIEIGSPESTVPNKEEVCGNGEKGRYIQ